MATTGGPSVAKVIELIGSSPPTGWEDAAANAVKEAAKTVKNIRHVYLSECTAKVDGGRIVEYRANVKVEPFPSFFFEVSLRVGELLMKTPPLRLAPEIPRSRRGCTGPIPDLAVGFACVWSAASLWVIFAPCPPPRSPPTRCRP